MAAAPSGTLPTKKENERQLEAKVFACLHFAVGATHPLQIPQAFEFSGSLLVILADHSQSGWFGTFFFNTEQQRREARVAQRTTSLWSHVEAIRPTLLNPSYKPSAFPATISPSCNMRHIVLWDDYYLRYDAVKDEAEDDDDGLDVCCLGVRSFWVSVGRLQLVCFLPLRKTREIRSFGWRTSMRKFAGIAI